MIFRSDRGSVSVIEAAVVYPLTVLSVVALIYTGMYVYDVSYLGDRAKSTAMTVSHTVAFAGYDRLGDVYSAAGMRTEDTRPDRRSVESAYSACRPYRYLRDYQADTRFSERISGYASGGIFSPEDISCSVEVRRRLFDREIVVTAEKEIRMPGVLRIMGAGGNRKMQVTASAVTSDPAEFIRNTDLTLRAADYIGVKTGIAGKVSEMRSKISGILGRLKAGIK